MITYTQYIHEATAEQELETIAENKKRFFCISYNHRDGRYNLSCHSETRENKGNYTMSEFIPFAPDSIRTLVKFGRLSRKELEKGEKVIQKYIAEAVEMRNSEDIKNLEDFILYLASVIREK